MGSRGAGEPLPPPRGGGMGWVSPGSSCRCPPSGWGWAVSMECRGSCWASSWARKSISSSSLGPGRLSPGEGEGLSGGEAPSPALATAAAGDPPEDLRSIQEPDSPPKASSSLQAPHRHGWWPEDPVPACNPWPSWADLVTAEDSPCEQQLSQESRGGGQRSGGVRGMRKGQKEKGRGAPHPTCCPCITPPLLSQDRKERG